MEHVFAYEPMPLAEAAGLYAMLVAASKIAISMPFAGTIAWTPLLLLGADGFIRERWPRNLSWLALAALLADRAVVRVIRHEPLDDRAPEGLRFVVGDENGNSAHGSTIAEARKDLVYKVVAKFDGKLPQSATGQEWIGIYRAVTGACAAGVRGFVESIGADLAKSYTPAEIARMVRGQFGAEAFAAKLAESEMSA